MQGHHALRVLLVLLMQRLLRQHILLLLLLQLRPLILLHPGLSCHGTDRGTNFENGIVGDLVELRDHFPRYLYGIVIHKVKREFNRRLTNIRKCKREVDGIVRIRLVAPIYDCRGDCPYFVRR